jgi:cyanophycin synthetase
VDIRDRFLFPEIHYSALAAECAKRGINWRRLPWSRRLYQIGEGARQLRLDGTWSSRTSRPAVGISSDKAETVRLLRRFGVPVPKQISVATPNEAWAAAQEIGVPIVVKPRSSNLGKGVTTNLRERLEVENAVSEALRFSSSVLIEQQIAGLDHRVTIAESQIIAVAKRVPACVIGDGSRTIAQLVAAENLNPLRSDSGQHTLLKALDIDDEVERRIAEYGYRVDSVPFAGETVYLRYCGNVSRGGIPIDVAENVHPENAAMLLKAVKLVGLDIAGIDYLTTDIARPWYEVGAAIVEVNSRSATRIHMAAEFGTTKSVMGRLLDAVYTEPNSGHLPTVVVYGPPEVSSAAEQLAEKLGHAIGLVVGKGTAEQAVIAATHSRIEVRTLREAHQILTEDPETELLVLHVDPARIDGDGLGISHVDVAVDPTRRGFAHHSELLQRTGAALVEGADLSAVITALSARGLLD